MKKKTLVKFVWSMLSIMIILSMVLWTVGVAFM